MNAFAAAAGYIRQHGWRHGWEARGERRCLLDALGQVTHKQDPALRPTFDAALGILERELGMHPVKWNDAPGRRQADVLSLLDDLAGRS